jgi:hypothetical protein
VIDFRYHLVSIMAVFLALAVGIVLGAEALPPKVASKLNSEAQRALRQNDQLNAEISQLKAQVATDNQFGTAASGTLLAHLLQGETVVMVTAPGADSGTVSGLTKALQEAGAKLTGTVSLAPQFFDTDAATESTLVTTAGQLAPAGVSAPAVPGTQLAGQNAAAKIIASAIMTGDGIPTLTSHQVNAVLNGFGAQGFLQVSDPAGAAALIGQATLAVVVIPGTTSVNASSLSAENLTLVELTHDLGQAGQAALLAGSLAGSGPGSAINAVTSGGAGVMVTTVDNADSQIGQIIVVQALRQELGPHPGPTAYGVGPGVVPNPAPTSSPTPGTSPGTSPSPAGKKGKK